MVRHAAEALQRWLALDEVFQLRLQDLARRRRMGLGVAVLVGVLGIILALLVHPSWWLMVAAAVGIGAWALWFQTQPEDPRLRCQNDLAMLQSQGLVLPSAWEASAVRERLAQLSQQWAQCEAQLQVAFRWSNLHSKMVELRKEQTAIEQAKQALVGRLGFSPRAAQEEPTWLSLLAANLRRLYEAQQRAMAAQAELDSLRKQAEELARTLTTSLRQYGCEESIDCHRLESQVEELDKRQQQYTRLCYEQKQLKQELDRLTQAIQDLEQAEHDLFEGLGLKPEEEAKLHQWTQMLPEYQDLAKELPKLKGALRSALRAWDEEVGGDGRPPDDEQISARLPDRDQLQHDLQQFQALANQQTELAHQLGQLENEISHAKRSTDLEKALAELAEVQAALQEEHQKAYAAVVGHQLVDWLWRSEQLHPEHPVLQRARDLFSQFTNGRYQLELQQPDKMGTRKKELHSAARLGAHDNEQKISLSLDELSSGTRVQLLLAARMAFIERQEEQRSSGLNPLGSLRLPMIFDETFANSDDQRTCQIIQAILALAKQGRQVCCLTAQEDELAKWKSALQNQSEIPWTKVSLPPGSR